MASRRVPRRLKIAKGNGRVAHLSVVRNLDCVATLGRNNRSYSKLKLRGCFGSQ